MTVEYLPWLIASLELHSGPRVHWISLARSKPIFFDYYDSAGRAYQCLIVFKMLSSVFYEF